LDPRRYPENPDGNGVSPSEVLHGDHQLMLPARFAAPLQKENAWKSVQNGRKPTDISKANRATTA
jgi:hypothetical protein